MEGKPYGVAVFGSSGITQESEGAARAERLGRLLAEAGFAVYTGGYMGAMEAAGRGARAAGGESVGVTCASFKNRTPNPHLTREIPCRDLPERIAVLMRQPDAYIVLDGSIGTLAECLLAWNILLMETRKPLVVVGTPMRRAIESLLEHTEVRETHLELIHFAETVDEAAEFVRARLLERA